MADTTDETLPMLEQMPELATEVVESKPEQQPAEDAAVDPEPEVPTEPEQEAVAPQEQDEGKEPNGATPSPPTTPGDKPIKPPRMKSMRSKESPPLLRTAEEKKDAEVKDAEVNVDVEATGDSEVQPRPYEPTTAPLIVRKDAVQPKKRFRFGLDYIMSNKWIILGIIAVVLLCLIILIVGVSVSRASKPLPPKEKVYKDPVVYGTRCGKSVGSWELNRTVAVFKGIPYAQPPTGKNRWSYKLKINEFHQCANKTEAKKFEGPCFQLNFGSGSTYVGSEDCLYLNIWTPWLTPEEDQAPKKELLPVLVYIHGGFLHWGSGHKELFSPSAQLAKEMNAVIVSFNYRLNVFGWMALEKLGRVSGNYGLYDQISALKWVKEYIKIFGGDPELVTVAGISSGGTSILALISNEEARSTFQRAWISGASSKFDGNKKEILSVNAKTFLRNVGCKSDDSAKPCLLNKTSEELVDAIPWIQYPRWSAMELVAPPVKDEFIGAVLINDDEYIRQSPTDYIKSHKKLSIPIIIGNTEYETDRYQVVPVSGWTWGQYSDYVRSKLDTFNTSLSDYVLNVYSPELKSNPRLHMSRHTSDLRSICPQTFIAEMFAQTNSTVYRYVMTAKTPQSLSDKYLAGSKVATHATDFALLFHYSDDDRQEYKESKERFRALLRNFMVTGKIPEWKEFPIVYNISSDTTNTTSMWTSDSCEFWRDTFFPLYSWMN